MGIYQQAIPLYMVYRERKEGIGHLYVVYRYIYTLCLSPVGQGFIMCNYQPPILAKITSRV